MELTGNWFAESVTPDLAVIARLRAVIFSGSTAYQKVEVLDSYEFGRSLVLDGKTQSTELDEFIYHESLVHPAMLCHPGPKSVFIGGGGEGGTLREALAHRSVESVTMIDLDSEVVELCRQHLPDHHKGSFDDPRLTLLHEDARGYLQSEGNGFDVMLMDLVDPLEGGPAYLLYTEEFYQIAKSRLNPGGVLVTQSGARGSAQPQGMLHHHIPHTERGIRPHGGGTSTRARIRDAVGIHHRLRRTSTPSDRSCARRGHFGADQKGAPALRRGDSPGDVRAAQVPA